MHARFPTYVNTLQSETNESEIIMKPVQSSYIIAQASHPPHRIVHNMDMAVSRIGNVRIVLNNLIQAATITTSFSTASQSCLHCRHSPLPRSRVFTRHCRAVMSSLTTAVQSCRHSSLPHSRVFTHHCHAVVSSLALPCSRVFTRHCAAIYCQLKLSTYIGNII